MGSDIIRKSNPHLKANPKPIGRTWVGISNDIICVWPLLARSRRNSVFLTEAVLNRRANLYDCLARMTGDSTDGWNAFLSTFYERFVASDTLVAEKFANTDMQRQVRMLQVSLQAMLSVGTRGQTPVGFQEIAEIHNIENHDINASLYDLWLQSFLASVAQFDPEVNPELLEEWEEVLRIGIKQMLAHYQPK